MAITGLGDISGRTELYFSVKEDKDDYDSQALVRVSEGTGLERINGKSATAGNGSLTVDDETAGNITVVVNGSDTAKLPIVDEIFYDVKMIDANGPTTKADGLYSLKDLIQEIIRFLMFPSLE